MWNDLNSEEKLDVKHIAVAWVITACLLAASLFIIANLVYADYEPYEPECTDLHEHSSSPNTCD